MIKLVFCCRRLPSLTRAEFQRYWREVHGPLVREHAHLLRIRKYVQVHTLDTPLNAALQESRGGADEFDGVAEIWWDSAEDLGMATTTDAGRRASLALLEDERRFIDHARSTLFVAEEKPVI